MSCSDRYATIEDFERIGCTGADLTDAETIEQIEGALTLAAGEISAAIASVGACNCTFASWATFYLAKLNVYLALLDKNCPCAPKLSDQERIDYREWATAQIDKISTGKIELCDGETGSNLFAFGVAENNATEWSAGDIMRNRRARSS